jgi:ribosomal 50S subunit-associated protein YjgA (DUF615 family)
MAKPDITIPNDDDLAKRLARYRRRVEAEGRKRSLRFIDRAISDAADDIRDLRDVT